VNCLFWDENRQEEWDNKSKPVKGSEKQPLGTLYTTHLSDVRDVHRNIIHQQWTGLCLQFWDLMSGIVSQWSGMRSRTERYTSRTWDEVTTTGVECPLYHPASNGVAECTIRVLTNAARIILCNAGLLDSLWAEVFNTVTYTHNRSSRGAKWTYPI